MTITHLLDTSALLASGTGKPGICAVTVTELKARLKEELASDAEAQQAVEAYLDALIAGTARAFDAVLVHRDPHLARIPREVVGQVVLPRPS